MATFTKQQADISQEFSPESLSWKDNPSAKRMLDLIVSLLKDEYIKVTSENPEIFS